MTLMNINPTLQAAIKAQQKRLQKLRKIRAMVAVLDRRRQSIPVANDRRETVTL